MTLVKGSGDASNRLSRRLQQLGVPSSKAPDYAKALGALTEHANYWSDGFADPAKNRSTRIARGVESLQREQLTAVLDAQLGQLPQADRQTLVHLAARFVNDPPPRKGFWGWVWNEASGIDDWNHVFLKHLEDPKLQEFAPALRGMLLDSRETHRRGLPSLTIAQLRTKLGVPDTRQLAELANSIPLTAEQRAAAQRQDDILSHGLLADAFSKD